MIAREAVMEKATSTNQSTNQPRHGTIAGGATTDMFVDFPTIQFNFIVAIVRSLDMPFGIRSVTDIPPALKSYPSSS